MIKGIKLIATNKGRDNMGLIKDKLMTIVASQVPINIAKIFYTSVMDFQDGRIELSFEYEERNETHKKPYCEVVHSDMTIIHNDDSEFYRSLKGKKM